MISREDSAELKKRLTDKWYVTSLGDALALVESLTCKEDKSCDNCVFKGKKASCLIALGICIDKNKWQPKTKPIEPLVWEVMVDWPIEDGNKAVLKKLNEVIERINNG